MPKNVITKATERETPIKNKINYFVKFDFR